MIRIPIKIQSNTRIFPEDIAQKPFVLWDRRMGRAYVQTAVILYAPTPPHPTENGGENKH